jgi:hypothetical protein
MGIHVRHQTIALTIILSLLMLAPVAGQTPKSLVASANGEGTLKLGSEEFKVNAVVVKLFEDGKAEFNLLTDISVFIQGTWSRGTDAGKEIEIQITGTVTTANLTGGGKLFLGEDRKSIAGLKLEFQNKMTKKIIKVDFVAK